ncbi:hypothetical protein J6590_059619 [Homalodisca vitripennis]|nr:hypothetical protein J6590_059619 [Homalodisca vitripennis]
MTEILSNFILKIPTSLPVGPSSQPFLDLTEDNGVQTALSMSSTEKKAGLNRSLAVGFNQTIAGGGRNAREKP